MPRKKIERCVECKPECMLFTPTGKSVKSAKSLEIVTIFVDEYEALRLADIDDLTMDKASKKMKISAPTFCRILASARKKVANALIKTKGIQICNGE